jgi:hypothetical protein
VHRANLDDFRPFQGRSDETARVRGCARHSSAMSTNQFRSKASPRPFRIEAPARFLHGIELSVGSHSSLASLPSVQVLRFAQASISKTCAPRAIHAPLLFRFLPPPATLLLSPPVEPSPPLVFRFLPPPTTHHPFVSRCSFVFSRHPPPVTRHPFVATRHSPPFESAFLPARPASPPPPTVTRCSFVFSRHPPPSYSRHPSSWHERHGVRASCNRQPTTDN